MKADVTCAGFAMGKGTRLASLVSNTVGAFGFAMRAFALLAALLLFSDPMIAQQQEGKPELEIRVWDVKKETTKEQDLIRIRAEVVNRSSKSLFIEVCCGWTDVPDRFHILLWSN
jgi:hypothetical protein